MRSAVALVITALCLAACPTTRQVPDEPLVGAGTPGYPGLLRSPSVMPGSFLWQQRVTARWGDGDRRGFDAALQKQGDTLVLVGLTPMGTKAFVVTQRGEALSVDNDSGERMPFPPRYIMLDVQRVFFPWLADDAHGEAAHGERTRSGEVAGERVSERFEGGRLRERCFERLDGQPAGRLCVTYDGWEAGLEAPARAVLDNTWFGYRIEIDTLAQQVLP